MPPAAKPITNALPLNAMHFNESTCLVRRCSPEVASILALYPAHGIKHNVDASSLCNFHHLLLPVGARVVDNVVRASIPFANVEFGW